MKRKIIFSILIVIILLNVLEIMSSKDTYVYCDDNKSIYLNDYENGQRMACEFENDEIAELINTTYFSDWKTKEYKTKFASWVFEAKSQGTTKVYLYRSKDLGFHSEMTKDDIVAVITLTVDENNHFIYERSFDYLWRVYASNFRSIFLCLFLMIIPYIGAFRYRDKRIKILNILLICTYFLDVMYYWILNIQGLNSILIIFCIIISIVSYLIFSKIYNKDKWIFKIILWYTGFWLVLMVYCGLWGFMPLIIQSFYLFVMAYILYCCGSKGIDDNN